MKKQLLSLTLGGILCALAVVIMILGSLLGVMTYIAPTLAGLCLYPLMAEYGKKSGFCAYAAASVLAFLLVPDRELSFFFIFFFGFYPLIYDNMTKIKPKILGYTLKLLSFNAAVGAIYLLLIVIMASPAVIQSFEGETPVSILVMWGLLNLSFILYDIIMSRIGDLYRLKLRPKLFK